MLQDTLRTARPKLALRLIAAVALALPLLPLSSGGAIADDSSGAWVRMSEDGLEPSAVAIATGGSVTWINDSDYATTLSSSNGSWPSQTVAPDGWWTHTFTSAGTYTYTATSMTENGSETHTGTVTVSGPGTSPSPTTTPPPPPPPTATPTTPPSPPTATPTTPPPPPTATPTTPPPPPTATPTTPPPPPPPTATPPPPPPTATPAPPSNVGVSIGDDFFSPATITIALGTTVTWTDNGSQHTVTCSGSCGPQSFDSGNLNTGATFSHTFTVAGTYHYICVYHAPGMSGTITVQ